MTASLLPCQICSNLTQYIKKGPNETQITVQMSEADDAFKKLERTFFRQNIRFLQKINCVHHHLASKQTLISINHKFMSYSTD
jgi:hypothetical protein